MVKKVSLNISDESYEKLASLSDFYKQDLENTIVTILDVVGSEGQWIINLSQEYKVPVKLDTVMFHMLDAGISSIYSLFNNVLEKLGVKGLYVLEDLEVDLDEDYIFLIYDALAGCNLHIDCFDLTLKSGLKTLSTRSLIKVEKINKQTLEKLKELVRSVAEPEEFVDLEDYHIEIEEDEEFWTLRIDCMAEALDYFPSVKRISKFVGQLFKKAGVK